MRKATIARSLLLAVAVAVASAPSVEAQTTEQIMKSGVIRLGYRIDAVPFSYKDASGKPAGYTVDLCRLVAEGLRQRLKLKTLDVKFVPVTTEDRFKAIEENKIDLLCGATTVTLDRREKVDFSVLTFFTGASVAIRVGGPLSFESLAGKAIGVRKGTTTETALAGTLKEQGLKARVVAVDSHQQGLEQVATGKIAAYFADRAILIWMVAKGPYRNKLVVARNMFGPEPYALAMRLGDTRFRVLVDGQLSRIYKSKAIVTVFNAAFPGVKPTPLILSLYMLNAYPD